MRWRGNTVLLVEKASNKISRVFHGFCADIYSVVKPRVTLALVRSYSYSICGAGRPRAVHCSGIILRPPHNRETVFIETAKMRIEKRFRNALSCYLP